jgi:hypothetical protein
VGAVAGAGGSCVACGGDGEPCCTGVSDPATCRAGLGCFFDRAANTQTCHPCGTLGEICCDYGYRCGSGLACREATGGGGAGGATVPSACEPCGGAGQQCCSFTGDAPCQDGLGCGDRPVDRLGICSACGAAGAPCCGTGAVATRTCTPGLTCVGGGPTRPACQAAPMTSM